MAIYRTTFPVAASPDRVWEVISNFDSWSEWNPSVPSIKGDLKVGNVCAVKLVMPGRPSVNVKVTLTDVDPGRRFAWHGNIAHDRFFSPVLPDLHNRSPAEPGPPGWSPADAAGAGQPGRSRPLRCKVGLQYAC